MTQKILQVAAIDLSIYKFVVPLMKKLKEEGFEVVGACKDKGYINKIEDEGFKVYNINIDRKISPISNIKTMIELYKIIKKEKIDTVHLHTPIAAALGRIAAKLAGVKNILYTAHGYYKDNKFFYNTEKFLAKYFTDYIFTVNQEDLEMAVNEGFIKEDKVLNINSVGIDIEKFNPNSISENTKEKLKKGLNIKEDDLIIGFIGRLVKIKGPDDLIKAFIKIKGNYPNAKLLMIGTWQHGERDLKTKDIILELIKENKIEDRVIFTGYRDDIPELLSIMDLFILPSYWEGMPVSLLEAMSMELPVIGTDIRGSREEIIHGECGLIYPPGDIDTLANSLKIILDDMNSAKQMGLKARQRVVEHFSEEEVLRKQVEVFKNLK